MNKFRSFVLVLLALMGLTSVSAASEGKCPKLIVGIVVDQMRWDYLHRYQDKWQGGFQRLLSDGFSYDNTYLCYVPTVTGVGHASIFTGTTPAIHGIAGNDFRKGDDIVYCTDDHSVKTVGSNTAAGEMSPRNMLTTTIGDQLKLAVPGAKVVGVSLKDRASILPAGHSADAAYWFDNDAGCFITSSYYMDKLPKWVEKFNAEHKDLGDVKYTPKGIVLTADMAIATVENEKLGQRDVTDMITVSFSSTDYVGHKYGTRSPQTEEMYVEVDRQLERLFTALDTKVGKGEYLVFLTADHAAAHNFIEMQERKIPAGIWREETELDNANAALKSKFGINSNLVKSIIEYRFYLDEKAINESSLDIDKVKSELVNYLEKDDRVMAAVDFEHLCSYPLPEAIKNRIIMGYNHKRSGDVMVILQPGYYAFEAKSFEKGTTHGVWYPYDSHIPLLFYGWNVNAGHSSSNTQVIDIATTVCSMINIQQPNGSVGNVLYLH